MIKQELPLAKFLSHGIWAIVTDENLQLTLSCRSSFKLPTYCGRPWLAAYINFNQNIHQIQVLTTPLCRAQAIFNSLPNNEWGTKYRGLTYSAKQTVCEICRATYSARQARLRIKFSQNASICPVAYINAISISF